MNFNGPLDTSALRRVEICNSKLTDQLRLQAIERSGLMNSPKEEVFDRLAFLAAKFLNVPLTIVSIVGDEKQFFKAAHGLPSPFDVSREIPIEDSICRYTLQNEPIIADDATKHELLKHHPTIGPWGIGAFIAIPMMTPDGHVLGAFCAVDTKARPWKDDDILMLKELTASVMREIHLREKISQLEDESILRDKFVAAISHDLRNPLNVAKMGAQLLSDMDGDEQERADISRVICENVDRADKMIQDLLTASRLKAGDKMPLEVSFGNLSSLLHSTVESLQKGHRRTFDIQADKTIDGHWDFDRVRRVVENFSGNAVKYGDESKPIRISVEDHPESARISVHNFGPMIPSGEIENLFNLFKRAQSARDSQHLGWGVGLTVARSLAEEMGGRIEVESTEEKGTIFSLHLPKVRPSLH
ncbi:MAG: GAF domain-containing sensor histidine kinase [Proteobacteria bacterium]|nr:MAG: GAF domain-containing sensor histidine kinase [Pseudomonadota bacterium]